MNETSPLAPPLHLGATPIRTGPALLRAVYPPVLAIGFACLMFFAIGPAAGPFGAKLLMDIGIAITLAVSLNIVNGYTGQFSLGHAGFMAVGGYVAGAITYYGSFALWNDPARHGAFLGSGEWLFCAATLAGGLAAALVGLLVGLPSLRLRGDYLAIVTLGFGEIVRVLLTLTPDVLYMPDDVKNTAPLARLLHLGGALGFSSLAFYTNLFWVYIFAGATVIVAYRLKLSSYGRAFLAIREDEAAAESMGVPVFRYKVRAFVVAAFFAGVAGSLFAHEVGTTLNPRELGFMKSIEVVIMVVLGGMGSISGAILAAIILSLLPELLRSLGRYNLHGVNLADYRMVIYALLLICMMLLRPKGLFGLYEIWDWLPRRRNKQPSSNAIE